MTGGPPWPWPWSWLWPSIRRPLRTLLGLSFWAIDHEVDYAFVFVYLWYACERYLLNFSHDQNILTVYIQKPRISLCWLSTLSTGGFGDVERIGWRISSKLKKFEHWPVQKCVLQMVGADRRFGGWGGLSPGRSSWQSLSRELVVLAPPESLQPSRGHCWKQPSLPPRWPNQQQEAEDRKCRRSKMALMLLTPSKSRRRAAKRCPVCNTTSILSTIVMPD